MGPARQWLLTLATVGAVALGLGSVAFIALAEGGDGGRPAAGTLAETDCPYENVDACIRAVANPGTPVEIDGETFVERPLDLPSIQPDETCPVAELADDDEFLPAVLGAGPAYLQPHDQLDEITIEARFSTWISDSAYQGNILVKGQRIDLPGSIQFVDPGWARDYLPLSNSWASPLEGGPDGWRSWQAMPSVMALGCYALQLDGEDFSQVIVFEVTTCAPPDCDPVMEQEAQDLARDSLKPAFTGVIGDFDVQADNYDIEAPCDEPTFSDDEGVLRASELWFEEASGYHSDVPSNLVCEETVAFVAGDSSYGEWFFNGGNFYYWDGTFNLPYRAPRARLVETTVAGRPALMQTSFSGTLPDCRLAVIERRPDGERPGIGWGFDSPSLDGLPVDCDEAKALAEALLTEFGEPWVRVASTPMAAVEEAVEESGREFAGHCETVTVFLPGPVCAWEHGTSGEQLAFGVSPVEQAWWASELYFVVREGEGWVVDHVEPGPCRNQARRSR